MRTALVMTALLLMCPLAALAGDESPGPGLFIDSGDAVLAYQRFLGEPNGALFTNLIVDKVVTGLRVTFASSVGSPIAFGFYADVRVTQNSGGVVTISGSIPHGGMVNIQWPSSGPQITKAEWIDGSNLVAAIDVHSPVIRVVGSIDSASLYPLMTIRVNLNGFLSYDPDGRPIVSYAWAWSDGFEQDGPAITRGITNFSPESGIDLEVTLTVKDAGGENASLTVPIYVPGSFGE